jgi:hypothetical protein
MLSNLQKLLAKIWSPLPSELFLSGLIEWVYCAANLLFVHGCLDYKFS